MCFKHPVRNNARFCLRVRARTLRLDTGCWQIHNRHNDKCGSHDYVLFMPHDLKRHPPHVLPRYLELELSRHVLRNIARFRLRAHTLRVETGCWQSHIRICDKCDFHDVQDEKHVLFFVPLLGNVLFKKEIQRTIC